VVNIVKELETDLIFKAWWRQKPIPESPDMEPNNYFTKDVIRQAADMGYTYKQLEDAVKRIKTEMPNTILIGSVSPQFLYAKVPEINIEGDWDSVSKEIISREKAWSWALDPSKFGLAMSKEEFQRTWAKNNQGENSSDPKNQLRYFFPDMTNAEYRSFLLHLIERQIDSGMDGIRIDMLFTQPEALTVVAKSTEHQAVKDSCDAISKLINEIHQYGISKGKYIYVGSWGNSIDSAETGFVEVCKNDELSLDYIHLTPSAKEIREMKLNDKWWDEEIARLRNSFGDIAILAFIDWGFRTTSPLGVFSQKLTPEKQREFLILADEFFQKKGVKFIYPIHGGYMGAPPILTSYRYPFGKKDYFFYDALAPEFNTFETIKDLAGNKK